MPSSTTTQLTVQSCKNIAAPIGPILLRRDLDRVSAKRGQPRKRNADLSRPIPADRNRFDNCSGRVTDLKSFEVAEDRLIKPQVQNMMRLLCQFDPLRLRSSQVDNVCPTGWNADNSSVVDGPNGENVRLR